MELPNDLHFFLYFYHLQLFQMEELRERRFDGYARVLQRAFRKYFAKRQRQKQREEAACKAQFTIRKHLLCDMEWKYRK